MVSNVPDTTSRSCPALVPSLLLQKIKDGEKSCFELSVQLPAQGTADPEARHAAGALSLLAAHTPEWPSALTLHREISVLYAIRACVI